MSCSPVNSILSQDSPLELIHAYIAQLPPSDLLKKFYRTSELGDVRGVSELISQVSKSDTELAEILHLHANKYVFKVIQETLF